MRFISLIFAVFVFITHLAYSQVNRFSEKEFLSVINKQAIESTPIDYSFNQTEVYHFDSVSIINNNTDIYFNFNSPTQNKVILSNKTFSDIKSIRFIIKKSSIILIENCNRWRFFNGWLCC